MNLEAEILKLENIAKETRINILKMLTNAGSGHTGGSLSAVELLVSLYFHKIRHKPGNPKWEDRDKFVLSKGHAAPVLYAVLAMSGYFPKEELMNLRKMGSMLRGHPYNEATPGVEVPTGSLGQGISMAIGMALAAKLDKKSIRIYALLGDGECQEGQVWEAAMSCAHYNLDNLCAMVDRNGFQIDGKVEDIMDVEPFSQKWKSFGWEVFEINGHSFMEILDALEKAEAVKGKPSVIIARTVKGKGVSFIENVNKFHGTPPSKEELEKALKEIGE